MATNKNIYDLQTLAKTSVDANEFLEISNKTTRIPKKFQVSSLFPTLSTSGAGSEDLFVNVSNKNQLNFKGIKSADTDLLTVTTDSNNIVLTALEAGIDLSLCNNLTSQFASGVDFAGTVLGTNAVVNGGTGLDTISKGAILYASANDVISATAVPSNNADILVYNSTSGIPVWTAIDAGDNITLDRSVAGVLTLDASLSTMAAELNLATYNVNLNTAAGASWITGAAGQDEGMTVDADGKVFIGEAAPTAFFDAALNIKGSITFDEATPPVIKPKARSGSSGVALTLEAGSAAAAIGGDLNIKAGSSTSGNHNGGTLNLYGGDEAGSGIAGSIKNFVSNSSGGEVEALTVVGGSTTPAVKVLAGNLIISPALKGIVHEGSGTATQGTSGTTVVDINSTSGVITLYGATLAAATNIEFQVTNDTVKADSVIILTVQDENTTNNAQLTATTHTITSESFYISVHNPAATGTTSSLGTSKVHFLVINKS